MATWVDDDWAAGDVSHSLGAEGPVDLWTCAGGSRPKVIIMDLCWMRIVRGSCRESKLCGSREGSDANVLERARWRSGDKASHRAALAALSIALVAEKILVASISVRLVVGCIRHVQAKRGAR